MREVINFNERWTFVKKDLDLQTISRARGKRVNLPHTWNNLDGTDGGSDFFRGGCWYVKKFAKPFNDGETYIEFRGANSIADVYCNGVKVAHHEGGYSTFRANLTSLLCEKNILAVRVDNSANDYVYPQYADFTFYGGLYRDVNLINVSPSHFDLDYLGARGITVTPTLKDWQAKVVCKAYLTNRIAGQKVKFTIFDGNNMTVDSITTDGDQGEFLIENPHLWQGRTDPYLYTLSAELYSGSAVVDNVKTRFGVRNFSVDAEKGFFLNGKSYPLHGVSRHQDREKLGGAITAKEHKEDMDLICEVGANTIRLAHYQHDQTFYDLCDERGMVVWAEIPFISQPIANGKANTVSQMKELVAQNYNHPSIVCWGLSNEISMAGVSDQLVDNHKELNDLCHEMDATRLTTMAQVSMLNPQSPLNFISDIISYNHYFGWYAGNYDDNGPWLDDFHARHPDRCLGLSEYGCEGILKWQTSAPRQGDYSETYQALYHEKMLETFATRPYMWSTHVWNMFDFGSDMRDEGGVKGRNNKGLVTFDRKTRKDSFYIYKAYWTKEPFVHLTGKRYLYRAEDSTKVKVYSNCDKVELFVNGISQGEKVGKYVFEFDVALKKGKNNLEARSGEKTDKSLIICVKKPYKKYDLGSSGEVANWFMDNGVRRELKYPEGFYSVRDKIADVYATEEGKQLIDKMVESFKQALGGGGGMQITAGMEKMVFSMSFERVFGLVGKRLPKAAIFDLNDQLNKIAKQ